MSFLLVEMVVNNYNTIIVLHVFMKISKTNKWTAQRWLPILRRI